MTTTSSDSTTVEPRRRGVNVGVTLMFFGSLPALVTVLLMPWAAAPALALLIGAYVTVLLGSGPLLKSLRLDDGVASETSDREIRREIAFGSTLMLVGLVLATCLVALVPGQWEKLAFLVFPAVMYLVMLRTSGIIRRSAGDLIDGSDASTTARNLTGASDDIGSLSTDELPSFQLSAPDTNDLAPPSVTEGTTRLLKNDR